jgi:hypothetical protein
MKKKPSEIFVKVSKASRGLSTSTSEETTIQRIEIGTEPPADITN